MFKDIILFRIVLAHRLSFCPQKAEDGQDFPIQIPLKGSSILNLCMFGKYI